MPTLQHAARARPAPDDFLTISCAGCLDPLEFTTKPPTSPTKADPLRDRLVAAMKRLWRSAHPVRR